MAVNPRDDGLGQFAHSNDGRIGVLAQRSRHVNLADVAPVRDLQISAGAEGIARTCEDDYFTGVFGGALNRLTQQLDGFGINCIAALRPVDGDALNAVFERHQYLVAGSHSYSLRSGVERTRAALFSTKAPTFATQRRARLAFIDALSPVS